MDYKDYYATLGVAKDADKSEIQKAYRESSGREPQEPPWLAEIRIMLERLEQET